MVRVFEPLTHRAGRATRSVAARGNPKAIRALDLRRAWLAILVLGLAPSARAEDAQPSPARFSPASSTALWALAQLIPSPLLVIGDEHVGGGMRWQLTPLLVSFGVAARPLRSFIVSPVARHSGSVELHASPEWACCAPDDQHGWLVRAGLRMYLPLIEHGEMLSWSFGASYHLAVDGGGPAGDLGLYTLFGVFGLNLTVSPLLTGREFVAALNFRYY